MSGDALRMVRCFGCKVNAFHVTKCEPEGILELQKDDSGFASSRILCPSCVVARHNNGTLPPVKDLNTLLEAANRSHKVFTLLASGKYILGEIEEVDDKGSNFTPRKIKQIGGEMGKPFYYFGSHDKGGGCDFILPTLKNKLHTRIRINHEGVISMEYALNSPKPFTYINGRILQVKEVHTLHDGDKFTIGQRHFTFRAVHNNWPAGPLDASHHQNYDVCPVTVPHSNNEGAAVHDTVWGGYQGLYKRRREEEN